MHSVYSTGTSIGMLMSAYPFSLEKELANKPDKTSDALVMALLTFGLH